MLHSTAVEARPARARGTPLIGALLAGPLGVWLACTLLLALGVWWYVGAERTIYFWDDAQYHDMTLAKAAALRDLDITSPRAIWRELWAIRESTWNDYSDFHAIPIVPVALAFGDSRLAYILALALIYTLPYVLIIGGLAARLAPAMPRAARWAGALLALATPAIWLPTLRGYPDTGAAALVGLAVLLYLRDFALGSRWQRALIGLCLGLAILTRRHFAYDLITFFLCAAPFTLATVAWGLRNEPGELVRAGWSACLRLLEVGLATLAALAIFGWPFVSRVLSTDFGDLYASYQVPAATNLGYYQWYYGLLACAAALGGLLAGLAGSHLSRPVVAFVLLFGAVSLGQWVLRVQQLGVHYTLHFSVWLVLGLVALGVLIWQRLRGAARIVAIGAGGACLLLNLAVALGPVDPLAQASLGPARALFPAGYRPVQRADYAEVMRLVDHLRAVTGDHDPIYVAASSHIISDDLLWQANRSRYADVLDPDYDDFWASRGLHVLHWTPFADSRDPYPLEPLLYSQYVVVATPTQYHMRPTEQDVLTAATTIFTERWEFSEDFVRLPETFRLAEGVTVELYQRQRPTAPDVAVRTLLGMQERVGERPGGQASWMSFNTTAANYVSRNDDGSYALVLEADAATPERSFLFLDRPAGPATLTGSLSTTDPRCGAVTVRATTLHLDGTPAEAAQLDVETGAGAITLPVPASDSPFLLLTLVASPEEPGDERCWVSLDTVRVAAR